MTEKPWYQKGLRFECAGCGACCVGDPGYVWIVQAEIESLATLLKLEVDEFLQRFVHRVGRRKSLIERPNGDCIFFDSKTRQCAVYKHRPRQCRTWPFWESNLESRAEWRDVCRICPGAGIGPRVSLEEIQRRVKQVKV